ncbi:DUF1275 family protein [Streptomyces sp. NPDC001046]|uniref:DUF1275 family protein n=1 Tax=unclassified Streptomyces TaxID=2593676 RepID=UPI0036921710
MSEDDSRGPEKPAKRQAPGPVPERSLRVAVVLLVAASGAVETVSFLGLSEVFAGVMTGNLALLGMAVGRGEPVDVTAALLALGGFGAGTAIAGWYTRGSTGPATGWPRRVLLVLAADLVLWGVGALVWGLAGGRPAETLRDLLQFGAATALGGQSAAMVTAGRAAAPTTYLTGTLAAYIVKGIGTGRSDVWVPLRLASLVAGAALSAALLDHARAWALLPPVLLTGCALLAAGLRMPRPTTGPKRAAA